MTLLDFLGVPRCTTCGEPTQAPHYFSRSQENQATNYGAGTVAVCRCTPLFSTTATINQESA